MASKRYGFTPKDRYGFGTQSGYGFVSLGVTNVCVTQGTDGTWYGARALSNPPPVWDFGAINPTTTVEEKFVFAIKWQADGTFIMRLGDIGNEPVTDTNIVILQYNGDSVACDWDEINLYYTGSNSTMATLLIDNYVLGEDVCLNAIIIPDLFISYDLSLERGTA